jgi:hypothetical protein
LEELADEQDEEPIAEAPGTQDEAMEKAQLKRKRQLMKSQPGCKNWV